MQWSVGSAAPEGLEGGDAVYLSQKAVAHIYQRGCSVQAPFQDTGCTRASGIMFLPHTFVLAHISEGKHLLAAIPSQLFAKQKQDFFVIFRQTTIVNCRRFRWMVQNASASVLLKFHLQGCKEAFFFILYFMFTFVCCPKCLVHFFSFTCEIYSVSASIPT